VLVAAGPAAAGVCGFAAAGFAEAAAAAARLGCAPPSKLKLTTSPLSRTQALTCCGLGFCRTTKTHEQQHERAMQRCVVLGVWLRYVSNHEDQCSTNTCHKWSCLCRAGRCNVRFVML
jgi:hypothetical protein